MEKLQIKDLTQDVEIFYAEDGEEKSRVFTLREHSRDELDEFLSLQMEAAQQVEDTAKNTVIDENLAHDITRASYHLVHDPYYGVVAYCLRHPKSGPAPDAEWCKRHVARRKAELVIQAQERLDGLDDPEKKAESIRAVMLASHQARRQVALLGSRSTTESLPATT